MKWGMTLSKHTVMHIRVDLSTYIVKLNYVIIDYKITKHKNTQDFKVWR